MGVTADTSAIELVLAVSSKDLEVERLVKVPEVIGREVYSQGHLTVGWHNPPEMIEPASDHRLLKREGFLRAKSRQDCCLGEVLAIRRAPLAGQPRPLLGGSSVPFPGWLRGPPDEFLLGELPGEVVLVHVRQGGNGSGWSPRKALPVEGHATFVLLSVSGLICFFLRFLSAPLRGGGPLLLGLNETQARVLNIH